MVSLNYLCLKVLVTVQFIPTPMVDLLQLDNVLVLVSVGVAKGDVNDYFPWSYSIDDIAVSREEFYRTFGVTRLIWEHQLEIEQFIINELNIQVALSH